MKNRLPRKIKKLHKRVEQQVNANAVAAAAGQPTDAPWKRWKRLTKRRWTRMIRWAKANNLNPDDLDVLAWAQNVL